MKLKKSARQNLLDCLTVVDREQRATRAARYQAWLRSLPADVQYQDWKKHQQVLDDIWNGVRRT